MKIKRTKRLENKLNKLVDKNIIDKYYYMNDDGRLTVELVTEPQHRINFKIVGDKLEMWETHNDIDIIGNDIIDISACSKLLEVENIIISEINKNSSYCEYFMETSKSNNIIPQIMTKFIIKNNLELSHELEHDYFEGEPLRYLFVIDFKCIKQTITLKVEYCLRPENIYGGIYIYDESYTEIFYFEFKQWWSNEELEDEILSIDLASILEAKHV